MMTDYLMYLIIYIIHLNCYWYRFSRVSFSGGSLRAYRELTKSKIDAQAYGRKNALKNDTKTVVIIL